MSARIIGVCIGLASLLLLSVRYSNGQQPSAAAQAQAPATGSVSSNGLANLRKRVARLERQMKPLVPLAGQLNKVEDDLAATVELYREKDAELESLVQSHGKTIELLAQQDQLQEEILLAISRRDSQNRPILPLLSIMQQSPEGAREIEAAVIKSLPQFGTVRIRNDTEFPQTVRVNGVERTIRPWGTEPFERIPMGVVTTELVGHESPKHWTLALPKREIEIRISGNAIRRFYEHWEWDPFFGWRRVVRPL